MDPNFYELIKEEYTSRERKLSKHPINRERDRRFAEEKYQTLLNNIPQFNFPDIIESYTDYIIAISYIKNGADRSGISDTEKKILKEYAKLISPLSKFNSPMDAYFVSLYSIPIKFESINKINNAVRNFLEFTSNENYDIKKALGRNITTAHVYSWLYKRHRETHLEIYELINIAPADYDKEVSVGMVHYCFYANKNTYKSKIAIAKKIYNFRVNSLKKRVFDDNSLSVKLQVELHHKTMRIIKDFSDANNISIGHAVHELVINGILNLGYGPKTIKYTNEPSKSHRDY